MRRIRYQVAMSLDGYIAGPNGEYDWIPNDPDIDFAAIFAQYDTVLIGRRSYEPMVAAGTDSMLAAMKTFVFSRTMSPKNHPNVTLLDDRWEETVAALRDQPGRDIWLFGGGQLFQSLLAADLVDTVELAIVPILLGRGVPVAPSPLAITQLKMTQHTVYEKSGIVLLEYNIRSAKDDHTG